MDRVVRGKLATAEAVRDYCRAHPSTDANYAPVLGRLEAGIDRMKVLARQQQGGYLTSRSATVRRRALRRRLHHELLRHLVTVAETAAGEQPALAEKFRLPPSNAANEAFRTLARKMLEQGQAERELLAKHGLADRLLDDLTAAVDEFDASVAESNQGRRDHVGARAELAAVSDQVMQLIELLDGLNRYRFGQNAELLAAWESARKVVAGPRPAAEEKEAPPAGEVKPAA